MDKSIVELLKELDKDVDHVLADVQVLDSYLLLANKSATQGGKDRAIEMYVQDAARFIAKWLPDAGIEVTTHAEAQAAHMVLMRLTMEKYREIIGVMKDWS